MPESAKRRKGPEAIGRDFARAVSGEIVRAATISHKEFMSRLRDLEKFYVHELEGFPEFALEVKRRVSEQLLEQAIFRRNSLSACRARLNAASRLGFTNIEQRAHCQMLYAQYAFARGNKRVAKRIASALVIELEQSLRKRKSPLAKQCLTYARGFLDFIDSANKALKRSPSHA
jgi:hypothetical protein